jgi:hypothetical protein
MKKKNSDKLSMIIGWEEMDLKDQIFGNQKYKI